MRTLVAAAVLALAGTACARARGPSADRAEGGAPATTAFDAARAATDKGEAVRALTRRHRDQVVAFGPHKFHGTAQAVLRDGDRELAAVEEDASIEAAGAVHARYANSKDVGRELYSDGKSVWVRPRYGKFIRRPPVEDEVASTMDDVYGTFAADVLLVADGLTVADGGPAQVGGRAA